MMSQSASCVFSPCPNTVDNLLEITSAERLQRLVFSYIFFFFFTNADILNLDKFCYQSKDRVLYMTSTNLAPHMIHEPCSPSRVIVALVTTSKSGKTLLVLACTRPVCKFLAE